MDGEHRTVNRVVQILEFVAKERAGVGLGEIASELGAPKSSTHSLVRGLVAVGYLTQHEARLFIGPAIDVLVPGGTLERVKAACLPVMRSLAEETDETIILGTLAGTSVVYAEQIESKERVRYVAQTGLRRPLVSTAMGKIFLASFSEQRVESILSKLSPAQANALRQEVSDVRSQGVAFNRGGSVPGVYAVSSGVRNGSDETVAAISVAGPKDRVAGRLDDLAPSVRAASNEASQALRARR